MLPFDLQVNGYAGVDFNAPALSAPQLQHACERLSADGLEGIYATIITDRLDVMCSRLRQLVALREQIPAAQRMIAGLHVEGPFLNPTDGYRGAHPADAICPADLNLAEQLLEAGGGLVRLLTLAPECDPDMRVTRALVERGIRVAAGHTDASLAQLRAAAAAGCTLFTHLGNGCPTVLPRHDNIIQRVLHLRDQFWVTMIADGAHVPFFVLQNFAQATGPERTIIISDAIAPAGLGPGDFTLGRWKLRIGEDLVARSPDGNHLVGSAVSLSLASERIRTAIGWNTEQIERATCVNPRAAMGI